MTDERHERRSGEPDAGREAEWVPADDVVIGRALRWSIAALAVLVGLAALAWWFLLREPPVAAPVEIQPAPPRRSEPEVRPESETTKAD